MPRVASRKVVYQILCISLRSHMKQFLPLHMQSCSPTPVSRLSCVKSVEFPFKWNLFGAKFAAASLNPAQTQHRQDVKPVVGVSDSLFFPGLFTCQWICVFSQSSPVRSSGFLLFSLLCFCCLLHVWLIMWSAKKHNTIRTMRGT